MVSDFGTTRYCKVCDGEIVRKGDAVTMYFGKKICHCQQDIKTNGSNLPVTCVQEFSNGVCKETKQNEHTPADPIIGLCVRCKKKKSTITYADSILSYSHGFSENICKTCYNKIRDENPWYKDGLKAGKQEAFKEVERMIDELGKLSNKLGNIVINKEELKSKLTEAGK
jgi:uncharacterized protein YwgA